MPYSVQNTQIWGCAERTGSDRCSLLPRKALGAGREGGSPGMMLCLPAAHPSRSSSGLSDSGTGGGLLTRRRSGDGAQSLEVAMRSTCKKDRQP